MDPYSAYSIATSRGEDLAREAEESRLARAARERHEEPRRRPTPERFDLAG